MGGLNNGKAKVHLIGLRIATKVGCEDAKRKVRYTPSYIRADGKVIPALCKCTAFINHRRSGKASIYQLSAWNKLADIFAKGMSPGKELYAECRVESYYSDVYNLAGQKMLNADGSAVQVLRHNFIVEDFLYGSDGNKFIDHEVLNGKRPPNWNDKGEGTAAWNAILDKRNATTYVEGRATFGFAQVVKKNAPTVTAPPETGLPEEVKTATEQADALKNSFGNMSGAQRAVGQDEDPF